MTSRKNSLCGYSPFNDLQNVFLPLLNFGFVVFLCLYPCFLGNDLCFGIRHHLPGTFLTKYPLLILHFLELQRSVWKPWLAVIIFVFYFFGHTSLGMAKNKSNLQLLSHQSVVTDQQHRGIFQSLCQQELCFHQPFPAELGGAVGRNWLLKV